jgi:hypothetical protein
MTAIGPVNGRIARASDDPPSTILGDNSERRQALDLLRQATVALRANRLDDARKLALRASDLNATYSLFDVRPEHILAEVERREQSGGAAAKPATAAALETAAAPEAAPAAAPAPKPASALTSAGDESADPFAQPTTREPAARPTPPVMATPAVMATTAETAAPAAAPARIAPIATAPASADETAGPLSVIRQAPAPRPQPSPGLTDEQLRARAIVMLDRGLQALDEHRFDDADRYARAALALHAQFSKLEYKPEYLITEVGIARARQRLDAITTSAAPAAPAARSLQQQVLPTPPSQPAPTSQQASLSPPVTHQPYQTQPQPQQHWQSPAPTQPQQSAAVMTASASSSGSATPMTSVVPVPTTVPAAPVMAAPVAATPVAATPVPSVASAAHPAPVAPAAANAQRGVPTVRDRAERMLEEAMVDLRAGRDDQARARIQAALSAIYSPANRPLSMFSSSDPPMTAAGPRYEGPQPGMPRAGFPNLTQASATSHTDSVLKPLHDPYSGDEATTTAKSSVTENTLREKNVEFAPMNASLSLDRPLPQMRDELMQPAAPNGGGSRQQPPAYASQATAPNQTAYASQATTPNQTAYASQTASPIQTQSASDAQATNPAAAPVPPAAAPGATPSQPGRMVFAPYSPTGTAPGVPFNSDAPRPGFLDRVWTAISGEHD